MLDAFKNFQQAAGAREVLIVIALLLLLGAWKFALEGIIPVGD